MAKTLRILFAPGFTTKGNTLTYEELDQNFIDLYEGKIGPDDLVQIVDPLSEDEAVTGKAVADWVFPKRGPFAETASLAGVEFWYDAVKKVQLEGTSLDHTYHVSWIDRNHAGTNQAWQIRIDNENNSEVARWLEVNTYVEPSGIAKVELSERNGSGITGTVWIDWNAIPDGNRTNTVTDAQSRLSIDSQVEGIGVVNTITSENTTDGVSGSAVVDYDTEKRIQQKGLLHDVGISSLSAWEVQAFDAIKNIEIIGGGLGSTYKVEHVSKTNTNQAILVSNDGVGEFSTPVYNNEGVAHYEIDSIRTESVLIIDIDWDALPSGFDGIGSPQNVLSDKVITPDYSRFNLSKSIKRNEHQISPSTADSFDVGSVVYSSLPAGATQMEIKRRTEKATNPLATEKITVNNEVDSICRFIKTGQDDWKFIDRVKEGEDIGQNIGAEFGVSCQKGCYRIDPSPLAGLSSFAVYIDFVYRPSNDNQGLVTYGNYNSGIGFVAWIINSSEVLYVGNGSGANRLAVGLERGKRYRVLYTLDGSNARLFVNGELHKSNASESFTLSSGELLNIGGYDNKSQPLDLSPSVIKTVRFFNDSLDNFEGNAQAGTKEDFVTHGSLIGEYHHKLATQNVWVDSSGNNLQAKTHLDSLQTNIDSHPVLIDEPDDFPKKNIYNPDNILHDHILTGSGVVADWDPQTNNEISGVGYFDCEDSAWYLIRGWPKLSYRVIGAFHANGNNLGTITVSEKRSIVFQAKDPGGTNPVSRIYFNAYRLLGDGRSDYPDISRIEVYKLDGELDMNVPDRRLNYLEKADKPSNISFPYSRNKYQEKKWLVLGDSITASDNWPRYMRDSLDITKMINAAIGGANIVGDEATPGFQNQPENPEKERQLTPQIQHVGSRFFREIYEWGEDVGGSQIYKPDIVIISMGYNDANNGLTIGDWNTIKAQDWTTTTVDTVYGSLHYNLNRLQNEVITDTVTVDGSAETVGFDARQARIIFQAPIQSPSTTAAPVIDYVDAIKTACDFYGIPVIDAYHEAGISEYVENDTGGKYLYDGIHPNKFGYRKLGQLNTGKIHSLFL